MANLYSQAIDTRLLDMSVAVGGGLNLTLHLHDNKQQSNYFLSKLYPLMCLVIIQFLQFISVSSSSASLTTS